MDFRTNIRLRELEAGQHWFVGDPERLVRVIGEETIDVSYKTPDGVRDIRQDKAVRVRATIPHMVIPGFIDSREAERNRRIRAHVSPEINPDEPTDDTEWQEIWIDKAVRVVVPHRHGKAAGFHDTAQEFKLFCHAVVGRSAKRERTSPCHGRVEALLIPAGAVPLGMFKGDPLPEPEPEEVAPPPGEQGGPTKMDTPAVLTAKTLNNDTNTATVLVPIEVPAPRPKAKKKRKKRKKAKRKTNAKRPKRVSLPRKEQGQEDTDVRQRGEGEAGAPGDVKEEVTA